MAGVGIILTTDGCINDNHSKQFETRRHSIPTRNNDMHSKPTMSTVLMTKFAVSPGSQQLKLIDEIFQTRSYTELLHTEWLALALP